MQHRLRDSTWTIVFKALIVVHIMIREGSQDATLQYLATNPKRKLAISNFTDGMWECRVMGMAVSRNRAHSSDSPNPREEHTGILRLPDAAGNVLCLDKD